MFLGKKEIKDRFNRNQLVAFADLEDQRETEDNLKAANLDLRVGKEVYVSGEEKPTRLSDTQPYIVLKPGQFALVKTFERVKMPPDLVGLISMRSRFKMRGLVNISGFHVDPNYCGHLIFAVQNVGPNDVRLRYKDRVFMIMWAEVKDWERPSREDLKERTGEDRITLEQMSQLGGSNLTLTSLREQINSLQTQLKIYGAVAVAALAALLIELFKRGS